MRMEINNLIMMKLCLMMLALGLLHPCNTASIPSLHSTPEIQHKPWHKLRIKTMVNRQITKFQVFSPLPQHRSETQSRSLKKAIKLKTKEQIPFNSNLMKMLMQKDKTVTDSLSNHARLKHQQASSSVTGVYNYKEVSRLQANTYHANLQQDLPGKLPPNTAQLSDSHSKFKNDQHAEIDLAKFAALNQESSEEGGVPTESTVPMTRMVVIILSTVAALFGMSMLVAIFQCCCRKKKHNGVSKVLDSNLKNSNEETKKDKSEEDNLKVEEKERLVQNELKEDNDQREKRESSEESDEVTVRNRVRKYEGKKDNSGKALGEASPRVRKRPESEAFKLFENKGILIGMGRAPKLQVPKEEEEEEKVEQTLKSKVQSPTDKAKTEPQKSQLLLPVNPDVVIASDDEDDDFNVIKRDQSILKSFTRAPPPKNRNRSSQALGLRRKQRSVERQLEDKPEDEGETTPILSPKQPENKQDSTSHEPSCDNKTKETSKNDTDIKEEVKPVSPEECLVVTPPVASEESTSDEQKSPLLADSDKELDTSGNIFLHIDPTAKRSSPCVTPPKSPKEKSKPSISPSASPKPVRTENLMKDLSEKLKQQTSDEEVNDKDTEKKDS